MRKLRRILKALGPGFITGAADDDPSGIGTYAQTGAQFGYSQLWMAPFSFPFMTVIQEICGRIGLVTGRGLASVIKSHYAKPVLYFVVFLLFFANTINIGANLGAMASSAQLLVGLPFPVLLLGMTILTVLLEVLVPYPAYAKFLKWLTLSLFAYIFTGFIVTQPWRDVVVATLIPTFVFSKDYLLNIVAVLGTTISPYLFFWQADMEVEEEIAHHKLRRYGKGIPKVTKRDIGEMRFDTVVGMFFSNLVMFFIIMTTATVLHTKGITSIETADQAAQVLRPIAGDYAFLLFAMGIIGTGLLSVPILAGSASYALSESLGWASGLNFSFSRAKAFYLVIAIATAGGLLVNFTPIKPFQLLYYTAVVNGVIAPPLMIMLMLISSNKTIMRGRVNSTFSQVIGWTITGIMSLMALFLLISVIIGW